MRNWIAGMDRPWLSSQKVRAGLARGPAREKKERERAAYLFVIGNVLKGNWQLAFIREGKKSSSRLYKTLVESLGQASIFWPRFCSAQLGQKKKKKTVFKKLESRFSTRKLALLVDTPLDSNSQTRINNS